MSQKTGFPLRLHNPLSVCGGCGGVCIGVYVYYIFFIHSSVSERCLHCFQTLTIVNSDAVKLEVQMSL